MTTVYPAQTASYSSSPYSHTPYTYSQQSFNTGYDQNYRYVPRPNRTGPSAYSHSQQ
jgi:hypothetical protein